VQQPAKNKGKKMELLFRQFRNRPLIELMWQSTIKTEIAVYSYNRLARNDLSIIGGFWQSGPLLIIAKMLKKQQKVNHCWWLF
jgi:hypothetical protein